jgi:pyruvate formate lyase activating enzyme
VTARSSTPDETDMLHPGRFFTRIDDGRIRCDLCPRACTLRSGQRGFCFVRMATDDGIALTTYGRSSGFAVDPIEKKPLFHFYPGTSVLSFGTAGCNLGCKFCQNWDISKAKEMDRLQDSASPEAIVDAAKANHIRSVAFTYNDPVIFAEYALDTARVCREQGIHPVAVTAGYIGESARAEFFSAMDATNVDLKAFTEEFYAKQCLGALEPVKETLRFVAHETDCWLEVTTLLIPGLNDDEHELHALSRFMAEEVGTSVPLHFSAFHPDYRVLDRPSTPPQTLTRARAIAKSYGMKYVYTGNVIDKEGQSTRCPSCDAVVVARDWYEISDVSLEGSACRACGTHIAGRFDALPSQAEPWGRRRVRLRIAP